MLSYPFLILSLLFLLPGLLVFALRADLRVVMGRMSLCALPFALTEFLFYPDYWSPRFLWDLVEVLGFGLEDLLFVVGLAAFTSTLYAFASGRRFLPLLPEAYGSEGRGALGRALRVLLVTFSLVALMAVLGVPMIYGSCGLMWALSAWMMWRRRDLVWPGLWGAALSTLVYTGLCLVLGALIPGVFALAWNTEHFLNLYVLGVPLEELLYAASAGLAATVFYPFIMGLRLVKPLSARPGSSIAEGGRTQSTQGAEP